MMKKRSNSYPEQFWGIVEKTIRVGQWEMECESADQAVSLRASFHAYVRALHSEVENKSRAKLAAKVLARTSGNKLRFENRDKFGYAALISKALEGDPEGRKIREASATEQELVKDFQRR